MRGHVPEHDRRSPNGSISPKPTAIDPTAADLPTDPPGTSGDPLLELLERWDERFRRGDDLPPEALGADDSALRKALRAAIENHKRLYAQLGLEMTPASEPAADPGLPEIPGHEIVGEIGRGGMGVVYRARDLRLGRIVAIKTIADGRHASPDQRRRFRAEAQAVARLRHPNIIAIHAIDEHDGRPFLSLEFAEGGSLAQRLADKPMAPREAAELLEILARAVHAAHLAGVVHRDLKPSNILLTADAVPKVGDFGLAKLLDDGSERTGSNQVMGSPSYMSPEQAEGHSREVGPTTDVYALGAILYQAMTGRPPFLGESALETIRMVSSTEAVSPRQIRPDLPRDLETICLKCLEKEPSKRYALAHDLAEDLRRYLDGRPIAARPVGMFGRSWRWGRRNPWVAGLSAAVFVILVAATIVSATLAYRAIRAEAATRFQRDRAEEEAAISRAVRDFVQNDMLAQAGATGQSSRYARPDPDLKVRTALDWAAERIGERFANRPLVEAAIRQTVGETYDQLGLFPQALRHLERALELRRRVLGPADPDTLITMRSLGSVYLADGKLSEAEPFLVGALDGLKNVRGPEHPETLEATTLVAEVLYYQGRLAEAEPLLTSARASNLARLGEDGLKTLEVTNDLGVLFLEERRFDLAERTLSDALRRSRKSLGAEHPLAILIEVNLADLYQRVGRKEDATRLFLEAIDGRAKVLGRHHPDTLFAMVKLGVHYSESGLVDEAEPLLTEALAAGRAALDRNHETTMGALAGLTNVYSRRGDLKRLEKTLTEAVEIARYRYGPDSPLTAHGSRCLGLFYYVQGQYDRAVPQFRDGLNSWIRHDANHPTRFLNELLCGMASLASRDFAAARSHFLAGYNGSQDGGRSAPMSGDVDLGWLIAQVERLRDAEGHRLIDSTEIATLRAKPDIRALILDLQFPEDPFMPGAIHPAGSRESPP